ncbi:MAG: hypothetical protein EBR09_11325 [Proteobacteria bacterium]|nr:hypothetical protein [Pseudomonadota bacterium]
MYSDSCGREEPPGLRSRALGLTGAPSKGSAKNGAVLDWAPGPFPRAVSASHDHRDGAADSSRASLSAPFSDVGSRKQREILSLAPR